MPDRIQEETGFAPVDSYNRDSREISRGNSPTRRVHRSPELTRVYTENQQIKCDDFRLNSFAFLKGASDNYLCTFMEREGNRIWTTPSKLISMNAPKDQMGKYMDN